MDGFSVRPDSGSFTYRPMPGFAMLDQAVSRFGNLLAIDFLGKTWTWAEIGDLADRAAAGLQKLGVMKGVNVGLCLPNTPYSVIMYYAILKAGGTVVNFNPLYTEREIENQAKNSATTIMVSIDLQLVQDKIGKLAAQGLFKRVILCPMVKALPPLKALLFRLFKSKDLAAVPRQSPYVRFAALIAGPAKPSPVSIDPMQDIAVLQFTGGTTGIPKAAMLTHANITANVQQVLASGADLKDGQERIMGILPFFPCLRHDQRDESGRDHRRGANSTSQA